MNSIQPPPTDVENELIRALHRAQFEKLSAVFGEKYEALDDETLANLQRDWLPFIRAFVRHELSLALRREAALRAQLEASP